MGKARKVLDTLQEGGSQLRELMKRMTKQMGKEMEMGDGNYLANGIEIVFTSKLDKRKYKMKITTED